MTSEQIDSLLSIADRYVRVEEAKYQLTIAQLAIRNAHEERAVAAQEKAADGKVTLTGATMSAKVEHTMG